MCHASQASGSAPGSASAHLFGAPGSASELLPVDAASVAEGGSGLAPSSSSRAYSARPACGSATATAKGTAASVAAAKKEDAAASEAVDGSGLAPSASSRSSAPQVNPSVEHQLPLRKKRKSSFVSQLTREWGPGGLWV
jgi:hypothetical protein